MDFAPMLKNVIERAIWTNPERSIGNKRNGKGDFGILDIETPEDLQSSIEPELVKKRQTILSEKIIGLYGLGMS